jgi:hypothetical protein
MSQTNDKATPVDDDSEVNLEDLSIAQLRKYAALYRIALDRDSTKEDIVRILKAKAAKQNLVTVVDKDDDGMPKPGWSRINVSRDPMPGAGNYPIYINVNGYEITVPRGVTVDVPTKVVTTLNDAVEERLIANHDVPFNDPNHYTYQKVMRYPFQVIATTKGPDPRPGFEVQRAIQNKPRLKFKEVFGYWPTRPQLAEAHRDGLLRVNKNILENADIESLLQASASD